MPKPTVRKFDKSVDSGPLPEGLDKATADTIQGERIRRQIQSATYPKPKGKSDKLGSLADKLKAQLRKRMGK